MRIWFQRNSESVKKGKFIILFETSYAAQNMMQRQYRLQAKVGINILESHIIILSKKYFTILFLFY